MLSRTIATRVAILSLLAIALTGCSSVPTTYASPELAATALADATRSGSKDKVVAVLGSKGADLIVSGDEALDEQDRQAFVALFDEHNGIVAEDNGSRTLVVGPDRWPFPVPIVNRSGGWQFDVEQGLEELTNRRIGRNELAAIAVCEAIVDAQRDYALQIGGDPQYAQKFVSDPGKRDGLFWVAAEGEPPSPLGPLVAAAADEGYDLKAIKSGKAAYHGYRYRILKSQGPAAPGGARDYVIGGKMIGGFAILAYPDEYGASGIMSFLMNHDGVVYQADLGANTAKLASGMRDFNPDSMWTKVADEAK